MRSLVTLLSMLALVLVMGVACGPDVPAGVEPRAQEAWEAWQSDPGPATRIRLIQENRMAAMRHGVHDDALGVLYQVRGTEALIDRAEEKGELHSAESIDVRVSELDDGEVLEVYDEVLPGARERLLDARRRARVLLQRD